ncbi:uncharacterized protein BO95DRAFT_137701 [Aspergillus brunneoviolaceus CBS 621.78]|uniref:Uncharacterized protein n=1 Tax=Aspergillus brunneoviolaceus CBS 621.78 TaxID=1450534 RepID=A0ACD1G8S0_9EURO|nr:hypothetical protein BO95DRAFT_137701 [Aspergillus brunneoviolaceus CBS 621.78]RAH45617.1 hypothetical protein BO95DRAFT_137701 [Aspergillus brunneoviolaceus CBS 621.78]
MPDNQKRGNSDDKPADPHRKEPEPKSSAGANEGDQDGHSLASRIQDSASGLARSVFSTSGQPSAETAQLLAGSGKASSASSSSQSALSAAQQFHETTGLNSSRTADQAPVTQFEAFRSSSTTHAGGFELPSLTEDEFQRTYGEESLNGSNGMYLAASAPAAADLSTVDTGKGKGRWTPSHHAAGEGDLSQDKQGGQASALPSDGAAVVSLLSDLTFDPNFPPSANEPAEVIETELSAPAQLTPAEIQALESFRRVLPTSTINTHTTNHVNPHILVPDISSFLESVPSAANTDAVTLRDAVMTGLPGAADWLGVEERYHDEVWGYLQPTLEAAAQELQSKDRGGSDGQEADGPAVRRLRMILKHMQTGPGAMGK